MSAADLYKARYNEQEIHTLHKTLALDYMAQNLLTDMYAFMKVSFVDFMIIIVDSVAVCVRSCFNILSHVSVCLAKSTFEFLHESEHTSKHLQ